MESEKQKQTKKEIATGNESGIENGFPTYINPKTDFGFKRLFTEGRLAQLRLLDLLKTFFPGPLAQAAGVVTLSTELLGDIESEKRVILDILAKVGDKAEAIVEMQRAEIAHFAERSIFYACRLVSKTLDRGEEYDIPTVLVLCITDKTLPEFADLEGYFHLVHLNRMDGEIFFEKIIFGYLDLSKFAALNPGQMKDMQFANRQEKWAYVLANIWRMELQDLSEEDEIFRSLFEDSMYKRLTKMEKEEYRKSVLEYEDVQRAVKYAREQGIEQGREEGMLLGEANAKLLLARNMLAKGLDPALVAEISGLSEEEVRAMNRE